MPAKPKINRREQILHCLAHMLETNPGQRITTARLAAEVGVTEAALYRHFPSKARMFEGLIEFMEESIFSRINSILDEEKDTLARCQHIVHLMLLFTERNPGITRLLTGDALTGEQPRLRERIQQFYNRLDTQFKQVLRERPLREGVHFQQSESVIADLMMSYTEGCIGRYVRSGFQHKPTVNFVEHWPLLITNLK